MSKSKFFNGKYIKLLLEFVESWISVESYQFNVFKLGQPVQHKKEIRVKSKP